MLEISHSCSAEMLRPFFSPAFWSRLALGRASPGRFIPALGPQSPCPVQECGPGLAVQGRRAGGSEAEGGLLAPCRASLLFLSQEPNSVLLAVLFHKGNLLNCLHFSLFCQQTLRSQGLKPPTLLYSSSLSGASRPFAVYSV